MKSRLGRALLLGAMVLGVATAVPARAESIKIGISKLLSYPAVPIAIAKGYFKEQGLDLSLIHI